MVGPVPAALGVVSRWLAHESRKSLIRTGNLFRIATGSGREAVTAAIFWLKVRSGWTDHNPVRQYPMGRKEAQQLAAETAGVKTPWEKLLRHPEEYRQ